MQTGQVATLDHNLARVRGHNGHFMTWQTDDNGVKRVYWMADIVSTPRLVWEGVVDELQQGDAAASSGYAYWRDVYGKGYVIDIASGVVWQIDETKHNDWVPLLKEEMYLIGEHRDWFLFAYTVSDLSERMYLNAADRPILDVGLNQVVFGTTANWRYIATIHDREQHIINLTDTVAWETRQVNVEGLASDAAIYFVGGLTLESILILSDVYAYLVDWQGLGLRPAAFNTLDQRMLVNSHDPTIIQYDFDHDVNPTTLIGTWLAFFFCAGILITSKRRNR